MKCLVTASGAILVAVFLVLSPVIPAFACGGGGGGGGGGGDDDAGGQQGFKAIEGMEITLDPNAPGPTVEELAKAFGPRWAAHNIIDPKTGMTKYEKAILDQRILEQEAAEANAERIGMETGYSVSKAAGTASTLAAGVVGTLAAGTTMAVPVTLIGIGADVLSTGAGKVADEMVGQDKSFKSALKSAVGPAIAKGIASAVLSKVNSGSKVVDGIVGTVGGMAYDEAVSGAPNSAPSPVLAPIGPTSPSAIYPSSDVTGKSF